MAGTKKGAGPDPAKLGPAYRAGQFSDRELARQFDTSRMMVARMAAQHGWTRDLAPAVRRRTAHELLADAVSHDAQPAPDNSSGPSKAGDGSPVCDTPNARTRDPEPDEAAIIAAATSRAVDVIRGHRTGLARLSRLCDTLAKRAEVAVYAGGVPVIDFEGNPVLDKTGKPIVAMFGLAEAAEIVDKLSRATHRLIPLERQAFALDAPGATPGGDGTEITYAQARAMALEVIAQEE